jgi:uncharacterized membrane protein
LKKLGIDSIAIRADYIELTDNLPKPLIAHVITNTELFLVVDKVDNEFVYVINNSNKLEKIDRDTFMKMWSGNILLIDDEDINPKKITFREKIISELEIKKKPFLIINFVAILIFLILHRVQERDILNYSYLILYSIGLWFSILLLIVQFDENNLLVKKYCSSTKNNVNCETVLSSKGAYFLEIFAWSDLGFIFLVIHCLAILLLPVKLSNNIAIISSIPSFLYVIYSLYYQKFIVRYWCKLCLGVQAVLCLLFFVSILSINYLTKDIISLPFLFSYLFLILFVISSYILIKPYLYSKIQFPIINRRYKSLIHNHDIKDVILNKMPNISTEEVYKIQIGKHQANNCLAIIFNPTCEPCIKELKKLLSFFGDKSNLRIDLIFLVPIENYEIFSIAFNLLKKYTENKELFLQTLNTYLSNYPASKKPYSLIFNEDVALTNILKEQFIWCKNNKIHSTPQLILNNKYLSPVYSMDDIDYMFL